MDKKFMGLAVVAVLVPSVLTVLMGHFYYPFKVRHTPVPDYAQVSNDQTAYFNAKLDQLIEEVKKVARAESIHVTSQVRSDIEGAKGEIVMQVQDVGDRVARSEGRMDALTLNKNFAKVFYPVGQEPLFFQHFPTSTYNVLSKTKVKNGTVLGYEYTVKRRVDVKNYKDPYNKTYKLSPSADLPVAHH